MELKDLLELVGICSTVLLCTWKLSAQITKINTTLDLHVKEDGREFDNIWAAFERIAPRTVDLHRTRR